MAIFLVIPLFAQLVSPAVLFAEALPDCEVFIRNLKLGMSGEDVRMLQVSLNSDAKTVVSLTGPGSKGLETAYFGPKTYAAVVKFQELYREEVLLPVALTSGTGFVGSYTRAKLARLCEAIGVKTVFSTPVSTQVTTPPTTTTANPATTANISTTAMPQPESASEVFQLSYPSDYDVSHGDKLTLYGGGFTPLGNTIHIGTFTIPNVSRSLSGTLETTIPENAPRGKFDLWVSNANGETNKKFIVVVERGTEPPSIKSFSPINGIDGTTISVTGEQFTKENNEVYFGNKPARGISSSDGKTFTFTLSMGLDGMASQSDKTSTTTVPIWFYVVNTNGISNNGVFTLHF
ncbi:MAG: hypothetical protein A3D65_05370 [Candidatus Lloydbacteria bacterium RIFCSPHIGHO2_02_FULL_50_13]|uniref:Uncharacterized protein n=1 Tax=Candidatus Lloydbacteria bacterium RIFCSPHIGHO2_02_FULL_50_13 TaxID=1798661 RepID=A0A1G2DAE4_9BACT|nr:MAG: hypothetical protein A3D65_05370 [Candidatus Lloydbacteria bacterium RIFCSPHIGHO2_02_FULL_50_13]